MRVQQICLQEAEDISEFLYQTTGMIPGYTQFSPGSAKLSYCVVELDGVSLLWAHGFAHCRWQDQMSDDGRVHFGFVIDAPNGVVSLGRELDPGYAMLFRPGQEMDYVFLGPVKTLEISVSKEISVDLGWNFRGAPLSKVPTEYLNQLKFVCQRATELAAPVNEPPNLSKIFDAREAILDALEPVLHPWLEDSSADLQLTSSYKLLKAFDDLANNSGEALPNLDLISSELGVGRRTLFYALRQSLGLTPRRYLEIRRLIELRKQLRKTDPSDSTVTDLATELGFGDLGRMAGKYRRQFGEYPSETLRESRC